MQAPASVPVLHQGRVTDVAITRTLSSWQAKSSCAKRQDNLPSLLPSISTQPYWLLQDACANVQPHARCQPTDARHSPQCGRVS